MLRAPRRLGRPVAVLVAVVLVLAPLATRSHWHGGGETATRCAVCVAAHHSPAVAPLGPAAVLPLVQSCAVAPLDLGGPGLVHGQRPSGRSPPPPPVSGVV